MMKKRGFFGIFLFIFVFISFVNADLGYDNSNLPRIEPDEIQNLTIINNGNVSAIWGLITGNINDQGDLINLVNERVPYVGATSNVDLNSKNLSNITNIAIGDVAITSNVVARVGRNVVGSILMRFERSSSAWWQINVPGGTVSKSLIESDNGNDILAFFTGGGQGINEGDIILGNLAQEGNISTAHIDNTNKSISINRAKPRTTLDVNGSGLFEDNLTGDYFIGDGSLLTNIQTFNSTYNNLLGQQCPQGFVINGTYINGTFTCIQDQSGSSQEIQWTNNSNITFIKSTFPQNMNITRNGNLTLDQGSRLKIFSGYVFSLFTNDLIGLVFNDTSNQYEFKNNAGLDSLTIHAVTRNVTIGRNLWVGQNGSFAGNSLKVNNVEVCRIDGSNCNRTIYNQSWNNVLNIGRTSSGINPQVSVDDELEFSNANTNITVPTGIEGTQWLFSSNNPINITSDSVIRLTGDRIILNGTDAVTDLNSLTDVNITNNRSNSLLHLNGSNQWKQLDPPLIISPGVNYRLVLSDLQGLNWTIDTTNLSYVLSGGGNTSGYNITINTGDKVNFGHSGNFITYRNGQGQVVSNDTINISTTDKLLVGNGFRTYLPGIGERVAFGVIDSVLTGFPGIRFLRTTAASGRMVIGNETFDYYEFGALGNDEFGRTFITNDSTKRANMTLDFRNSRAVNFNGINVNLDNRSNGQVDSCTLSSGTCTITNTRVTASTVILCTSQSGSTNLGSYHITSRNSGVNYTVASSNILENNIVGCILFNGAV